MDKTEISGVPHSINCMANIIIFIGLLPPNHHDNIIKCRLDCTALGV